MAKKKIPVTLRKPTPPSESTPELSADSFVHQGTAATTLDAPAPVPDSLRALTLYLPLDLADRVVTHCRVHDRDVGNWVAEVLGDHFAALTVKESRVTQHAAGASPAYASPAYGPRSEPALALLEWVRSIGTFGSMGPVGALRALGDRVTRMEVFTPVRFLFG